MQMLGTALTALREALKRLPYRTIYALMYVALGVAIASASKSGVASMIANIGISPTGYGIVLALCGAALLNWRQAPFLLLSLPFLGLAITIIHYIETRTDASLVISIIVVCVWLISQRIAVDDESER